MNPNGGETLVVQHESPAPSPSKISYFAALLGGFAAGMFYAILIGSSGIFGLLIASVASIVYNEYVAARSPRREIVAGLLGSTVATITVIILLALWNDSTIGPYVILVLWAYLALGGMIGSLWIRSERRRFGEAYRY